MPSVPPLASTLPARRLAAVLAAFAVAVVPAVLAVAPTAQASGHRNSEAIIDGPDVASYQHPYGARINWHKVARSHKDFAIVKATEGSAYRNPWFHRDYVGARRAGLVRGSYHFARPHYPIARSARHQARFFVSHLGDTRVSHTLPPALDLEATGGLGRGALVTWAQTFLMQTRKLTHRTPLIYTYPYFWTSALGDPVALERYPLWMAAYSGPVDPTATLWQYTAGAHVNGIRGHVDMSRFRGPVDVWNTLRDGTAPSPWPAATPGGPVHVSASGGDGYATVSWLPGDTGSSAIKHYHVTAQPGGSAVTVSGTTMTARIGGLRNGTRYAFTVSAVNSLGDGTPSRETNRVTPMVPTALSVGGPTTTTFGHSGGVVVRLTRPDRGHGLPGRELTIERRVHGQSGWTVLRNRTTGPHGYVRLHLTRPAHNADYRFTYDGPVGWRQATGVARVVVRNDVTAKLSRHRVRHGHHVTMHGRIRPAVAGVTVKRQAFYRHRWHVMATTRTGRHGRYAFRILPTRRAVLTYRTVVAGFDGRSHGYSPIRRLRVH